MIEAAAVQIAIGTMGVNQAINAMYSLKYSLDSLVHESFAAYQNYERLNMSIRSLVAREYLLRDKTLEMSDAMGRATTETQRLIKWTERLAIKSPFTQEGVVNAFKMVQSYGYLATNVQKGAIGAKEMAVAMMDVASGTGGGEEAMSRMALAIGQIKGMGRLMGQEVNQLRQVGVNLPEILAVHLKKTVAQVMKMKEQGKITSDMVDKAFVSYATRTFGGAAALQAETYTGMLASLSDISQIAKKKLFEPFWDNLKPLMKELIGLIEGKSFQNALNFVSKTMGELAATGSSLLIGFKETAIGTAEGFAGVTAVITAMMNPLTALAGGIGIAAGSMVDMEKAAGMLTGTLGKLGIAFDEDVPKARQIGQWLPSVIAGITTIVQIQNVQRRKVKGAAMAGEAFKEAYLERSLRQGSGAEAAQKYNEMRSKDTSRMLRDERIRHYEELTMLRIDRDAAIKAEADAERNYRKAASRVRMEGRSGFRGVIREIGNIAGGVKDMAIADEQLRLQKIERDRALAQVYIADAKVVGGGATTQHLKEQAAAYERLGMVNAKITETLDQLDAAQKRVAVSGNVLKEGFKEQAKAIGSATKAIAAQVVQLGAMAVAGVSVAAMTKSWDTYSATVRKAANDTVDSMSISKSYAAIMKDLENNQQMKITSETMKADIYELADAIEARQQALKDYMTQNAFNLQGGVGGAAIALVSSMTEKVMQGWQDGLAWLQENVIRLGFTVGNTVMKLMTSAAEKVASILTMIPGVEIDVAAHTDWVMDEEQLAAMIKETRDRINVPTASAVTESLNSWLPDWLTGETLSREVTARIAEMHREMATEVTKLEEMDRMRRRTQEVEAQEKLMVDQAKAYQDMIKAEADYLIERDKMRTDYDKQLQMLEQQSAEERLNIQIRYQEQVAAINEGYAEQVADIWKGYYDGLADLAKQRLTQIADLHFAYTEAIKGAHQNAESALKEAFAVGIDSTYAFMNEAEARRAQHVDTLKLMAKQGAWCQIDEEKRAFLAQEKQAALAYAQQLSAQQQHLGRMLASYVEAQGLMSGMSQDQVDAMTGAIRQQFGITETLAERSFGSMRQLVDEWVAGGGANTGQIVAQMDDARMKAIEVQRKVDELTAKKTDELAESFAKGTISVEEYQARLANIGKEVNTELGIVGNAPLRNEEIKAAQEQYEQQLKKIDPNATREEAEKAFQDGMSSNAKSWYERSLDEAQEHLDAQLAQAAQAHAKQLAEAKKAHDAEQAQLVASMEAQRTAMAEQFRLAEEQRGLEYANQLKESADFLAAMNQATLDSFGTRDDILRESLKQIELDYQAMLDTIVKNTDLTLVEQADKMREAAVQRKREHDAAMEQLIDQERVDKEKGMVIVPKTVAEERRRGTGEGTQPGRATGGLVHPQQVYTVGERGPELFVPHGAGKVMPIVEPKFMPRIIPNITPQGGITINISGVTVDSEQRMNDLVALITEKMRQIMDQRLDGMVDHLFLSGVIGT